LNQSGIAGFGGYEIIQAEAVSSYLISQTGRFMMDAHVYKTIQITGSSNVSSDDAVKIAVERASKTVHNLKWFKVTETRGYIKDGKIADWQVSVDLGFALE
jgi:flavin-binding protein dodecin